MRLENEFNCYKIEHEKLLEEKTKEWDFAVKSLETKIINLNENNAALTILPKYYSGNLTDFVETDSIDLSILRDEDTIDELK